MAVILTEALTELVVKSELFWPMRKWLFDRGQNSRVFSFFHELIDCGYCFSVWAGFFSLVLVLNSDYTPILFFITGLIIHRLSNLIHNLIDKTRTN
jgi:hypothetical protein